MIRRWIDEHMHLFSAEGGTHAKAQRLKRFGYDQETFSRLDD